MKITSLLRIRNEELIIEDTLRHLSEFSDEIYVFDDDSIDGTVKICERHPLVKKVIRNHFHSENQSLVQTAQRKLLLDYAKAVSKNKWFGYFDCDERLECDFTNFKKFEKDKVDVVYFQLFDAYLTKNDQKPYKQGDRLEDLRKYFGPEYRFFCCFFRGDKADYNLRIPTCRQPNVRGKGVTGGYIKHYGKSISVKQWDETAKYYIKSVPQLTDKWKERIGKAIHIKSDFGRKLLTWEQIKSGKHSLVKI